MPSAWTPVLLIMLLVIYGLISFVLTKRKFTHLPGPSPWPLIGNYLDIHKHTSGGFTIQDVLLKWAIQYGSIYKIWIGNKPWIIVSDPDLVKEVLTGNKFPKDPNYYTPISQLHGQRFAGQGSAIQVNPDRHKQQLSIVLPAFHKKYLHRICPLIQKASFRWIDQLREADDKKWHNVVASVDSLSVSIICQIAFGLETQILDDSSTTSTIQDDIKECFNGIADKLYNPMCNLHFKKIERRREAAKNLREIGAKYITERYEKIQRGETIPEDMFSFVLKELHDGGGVFTLEEIIDEFIVFLVAGTETIANLIKLFLMEITRHPEVYKRLEEECDRVLDNTTPETYYDDLNKLVYFEQVLKEMLRLYPIALATTRTTAKDTQLGKHCCPKGSTIMVCFYVNHRHPRNFERPEEFDPDRWAPGMPNPIPYTYTPFSSGSRKCIGKNLAIMEVKIVLSNLIHLFKINGHPDTEYNVTATLSLKPKSDKILLQFQNRNRSQQS